MKTNVKNIFTSIASFCVGVTLLSSCTSNFEDYNRNPGEPTNSEMEPYIRVLAFKQMISNVYSFQENSYQMNENLIGDPYGRYLSIANSGFTTSFSTFNAGASWVNYPFEDVLPKFNIAWLKLHGILENDASAAHLIAWSNILRVATMHRMADIYGPIPYSTVENGTINSSYDSVETLYREMISDLDTAIRDISKYLDTADSSVLSSLSDADVVYGADLKKWLVFANSLKLRLAMRTVYIDPAYAKQKAEEAVNNRYGTILTNKEAPSYFSLTASNPIHKISTDWGDSMPAADIITYMKGFGDPRISKYFKEATLKGAEGKYLGVRTGVKLNEKTIMNQYSKVTFKENDPIQWMTAAEVAFLKAEGALRGWNMGGTAQSYYELGVRLSFEQWAAGDADLYLADATSTQANYSTPANADQAINAVSTITIKWEGTDFEKNLERIITQKWIAIYPLGTEAWSEQRRTGYPKFFPVMVNGSTDATLTTHLASRIPFPPSEKDRNTANYTKAVQMLGNGGDNYSTRLWWDAKPNKW